MKLSESELFELKQLLPKCGRMRFHNSGQYFICQEPVISGVVPCPICRELREQET
jgi:hypothetical protein